MDFGHIWKPPIRSKEKQKDGKGQSIGSALTGDADMILWRERPCVDRIFRIVRCLAHGKWMRVLIARYEKGKPRNGPAGVYACSTCTKFSI
jgi:hypothetical protein